jgi:predicted RNA binding protein YcfA (HicA-like mRNA interferase family)
MPMKVRDILKMLRQDGWVEDSQRGSHKQFTHPTKPGKVTVPIHGLNEDLHPMVEKSILRQAGLK